MAFRTAFVLCLVLVPCALAATKRFKRQFPGIGGFSSGFDFQGIRDQINQLNQQAQNLANTQMGSIPMQDMSQFLQNIPSLEEFTSSFTQEELRRLSTLATTNQNFQRELAGLAEKGNLGSEKYKQLLNKYKNANPNAGNVATNTSQNNPNMLNPSMGGQNFPNFEESMSRLSPDEQAAMQTFLTSPDFQKEYTELQEKYVGRYNSDEYKQDTAALINKYNSGAGLVVSLVTLVASLVVQGLMMFG